MRRDLTDKEVFALRRAGVAVDRFLKECRFLAATFRDLATRTDEFSRAYRRLRIAGSGLKITTEESS